MRARGLVVLTPFTDGVDRGIEGRVRNVAATIDERAVAEMRPDMRVVVVRLGDGSGWGFLVWDDEGGILASDDGQRLETAEEAERVASAAARQWYTLADDDENEPAWCGHDECDADFCDRDIKGG